MKKLLADSSLAQCDFYKSLLESRGIGCVIKNEFTSSTAGAGFAGPLDFARPELWVIDDAQFADALAVLREHDASPK